jgi:tetratricopeptide (TPR) repeat protein
VRYWSVILLLGVAAGSADAEAAAPWESDGRARFLSCEFKEAAHAFENAVRQQPGRAVLYYWLGKSYARLAEISGPLRAPKNARKARRNLERAVELDPHNDVYLRELFDFYVDSPEWFGGGLARAGALLERIGTGEADAESLVGQLADSRKEHSGAGWWMRRAVLRTGFAVGGFVPQP